MKNSISIGFLVYRSGFLKYHSILLFLIFSNLNFLNGSGLVFSEPIKSNLTDFTGFHKNLNGFSSILQSMVATES
jgi:hypothetical protein